MFFDDIEQMYRVVIIGVLAYIGLVLFLRLSGKRTLSKMNAFDLIVTVALGSTLATVLLSSDIALFEGLMGFVVLIGLQYLVAWLSVRSRMVSRLVKSEPRMLVYHGQVLHDALAKERVVEEEIRQAMRSQGITRIDDVEAVVLETDGTFAVIQKNVEMENFALRDVRKSA